MPRSHNGRAVIARPAAACALALLLAGSAGAHETDHGAALPLGYGPLQFEAPAPGTYALPALGSAADGQVLDADGRRASLHELYGDRIVLLAFVYTSCSDIGGCPLALAVMEQIKTRIEKDPTLAERTRLLTLSFDPVRDTPDVMRAYGSGFRTRSADWRFLTTSSADVLAPILAAYGQPIQSERAPDGTPTGRFSHLLRVFLIDGRHRIRNIYSSSFLHADLVTNDMRTLLLEQDANGSLGARAGPARPSVDLLALAQRPPLGLPQLPVPDDNALERAKVDLGRKLFMDRRLSHNGTMSCAMCHIPEQGFTNRELATAIGIEGRTVRRNAPTLYNVAYATRLFHDGREGRLERQIWGPLLARNEMGNPSPGRVIERIESLPDYAGLFERAFDGRGPGMETLGMALASYQRTLLLGNSPFDRWHFGGQRDAMSPSAARGFELFAGKAGCLSCHRIDAGSALFSDDGMHNTGIGYARAMSSPPAQRVQLAPGVYTELSAGQLASISEQPPGDLGLYEITLDPADRWKYRTPSLRNVALTPPYMHDGSLATLRAVVEFYDRGGIPNETLDPSMRPLSLSPREIDDLVAFLQALTGQGADLLAKDARSVPIGDRD